MCRPPLRTKKKYNNNKNAFYSQGEAINELLKGMDSMREALLALARKGDEKSTKGKKRKRIEPPPPSSSSSSGETTTGREDDSETETDEETRTATKRTRKNEPKKEIGPEGLTTKKKKEEKEKEEVTRPREYSQNQRETIKDYIRKEYPGVREFYRKYNHLGRRCRAECNDTVSEKKSEPCKFYNEGRCKFHGMHSIDKVSFIHVCAHCWEILLQDSHHRSTCQECPVNALVEVMKRNEAWPYLC